MILSQEPELTGCFKEVRTGLGERQKDLYRGKSMHVR